MASLTEPVELKILSGSGSGNDGGAEEYQRERRRLTKEADAAQHALRSIDLLDESTTFLFEEIRQLAWTTFTLTVFASILGVLTVDGYMILLTWLLLPLDLFGLFVYHVHRRFGSGVAPKITLLNMYEIFCTVVTAIYAIVQVLRWTVYFSPSSIGNWIDNFLIGLFFVLAMYKAIIAINLRQKRNKVYVDIAELHDVLEKETQQRQ